jgi:hypothetical protein
MKVITNVDFKRKRRFNPIARKMAREVLTYVDDGKYNRLPGPNCMTRSQMLDHVEKLDNTTYTTSKRCKEYQTHIEDCERCESLFYKLVIEATATP